MSNERGVIIVLGAPNDERGELSSIARERCEAAAAEWRRRPGYRVLPTGGFGAHFNTTAQPHHAYSRAYLEARGVPAAAFVAGVASANTVEDARLARAVIEQHNFTHLLVVTSDFHAARAAFCFTREFPERRVTLAPCATTLPAADLAARQAHEARALARLRGQSPR